ncbi:MAG: DNA polymerase III subunit chi [Magnetococcales bacterium]|nr:DNA polymerase III subunit chi [Magnetococcales bacterium]
MSRLESDPPLVRFYQWNQGPLERILFGLLSRVYDRNLKACVVVADMEHARRLDTMLWTMESDSFLPHGACRGADSPRHPIILCTEPSDVNGASVLILAHGRFEDRFADFDQTLDFVVDHTPEGLQTSRGRYRRYRDAGGRMEFWVHTREDGWRLKAKGQNESMSSATQT